jgi:intimin
MKVKSFIALLLTLLTFVIAGCGDDGPKTTPFATAPTASAPVAAADGTTATSTITAILPVGTPDGTVVNFAITSGSGTLSSATATTVGGVATVTLTSTAPGDVIVSVTSGTSSSPVTVTTPAGALVVTANPASIPTGTTSVISAQLPTATLGVTVSFTLTGSGTLSAATAVTDATGLATVTLAAPAAVPAGATTVTATAGLLIGNVVPITYIDQPTLAVVTVSTQGTLPPGTLVGAINAVVTYTPTTFTIADTDVIFAGPGLGLGTLAAQNTATVGQVTLGLINAGLGTNIIAATGLFATLNFHVPVGTFTAPTVALAAGSQVLDTNGAAIPGVTVVISSPVLQ